ncbi:MAG: cupin domain-containing protein [Lapillicoccus sp.]
MQLVSAGTRRTTTTPSGTMTTLASPTQGGATHPLWLVAMRPGAEGPLHAFEAEVVWSLTEGGGSVWVGGREERLTAGDTVVLAPGELRQFVAGAEGFRAVVTTVAPGRVTRGDGSDPLVPEWVA